MPNLSPVALIEQVEVHHLGPGVYVSNQPPTRLSSLNATSFEGNMIAVTVYAAYQEARKNCHLYSISGYFLRPTRSIRAGKSFQIFESRVTRVLNNGLQKLCLVTLADFHVKEPRSIVLHTTPPDVFSLPAFTVDCPTALEQHIPLFKPLCSEVDKFVEMQTVGFNLCKSRTHPEMPNGPPSFAVHAEKFRMHESLDSEVDQMSALALYMDKGLAYNPALYCGHQPFDADVCATLDFSLRLFDEGRVWDPQGRLLASMTQQTILRPRSGGSSKL
ncbi:hypothetical protein BJX62DRAFT_231343 [Aspergillus germanicus]